MDQPNTIPQPLSKPTKALGPKWSTLLISLVVLIVLVVGYGVLAKNYNWWPATSDVDMTGWQTYRNEEYGFEFMYPKTWAIKEEYSLNDTRDVLIDTGSSKIAIDYTATLSEFLNMNNYYRNNGIPLKEFLDKEVQGGSIRDVEDFSIGGVNGYEFNRTSQTYPLYAVIVIYDGAVYTIASNPKDQLSLEEQSIF